MAKPDEALILAGGLGSRLRPAVADVPKPMAPVNGRPFLDHLLEYWLARGVGRFVISVGHLADCVINHFGGSYRGAAVEYVREEAPLGTGGALALAFRQTAWRGKSLLLLNGDTWLAASLERLAADSEKPSPPPPVTLTLVRVEKNDRYGGVELDSGGGIAGLEAPADGSPALINAGCYLLRTEAARAALSGRPERFSLERDWLAGLAKNGRLGASVQDADFIDIGVPGDYRRFCQRFGQA